MEFADINKLLDVYRKRLLKGEDDRRIIIESIQQVTGITLLEKEIVIKNTLLVIKSDGVVRNELFIYKEKIIEIINTRSVKKITDIQ